MKIHTNPGLLVIENINYVSSERNPCQVQGKKHISFNRASKWLNGFWPVFKHGVYG